MILRNKTVSAIIVIKNDTIRKVFNFFVCVGPPLKISRIFPGYVPGTVENKFFSCHSTCIVQL